MNIQISLLHLLKDITCFKFFPSGWIKPNFTIKNKRDECDTFEHMLFTFSKIKP